MPLMQNPPGSFTLVIVASRLARNRRREARTFVTSNDRATSSCSEASSYSLYNGQLPVEFANETTEHSRLPPEFRMLVLVPALPLEAL